MSTTEIAEPLAHFVDGRWVADGELREDVNPSDTHDVVRRYAAAGPELVAEAVEAAQGAQPGWARTSPQVRADILARAGAEVQARKDELGTLLAREEGKTLPEATGEVVRAAQILQFFSGEALRMGGERLPSTRPGVIVDIVREPVGVIGAITPWNFPIAIPAWKAAPALAYGNTVILKPAELTPGCAHALVEILARAGLPDGVLNLVMGSGSIVGQALVDSPGVDALTFTGSEQIGRAVAAAAVSRLTKVQLEMGGKNPLVVAADADLDVAVDVAVQGAYYSTGQRCTASSRLIVVDEIHDAFVEALVARMRGLSVGHALDPGTEIGPVVDDRQLRTDVDYLQIARDEGAEEIVGGGLLERPTPGHYLAPALVLGTTNEQCINREEVFGPVASVIRVGDYEEALAVANDTPYGLCAGICTRSLHLAEHFQAHAEAGMVMVNLPTAGVDPHVPFGGRKGSSYGPREQGSYAREFFTATKTAYRLP